MAQQHVGGPYEFRFTGVRLPVADAPLCGVRAVICSSSATFPATSESFGFIVLSLWSVQ
jgi:hypothetical protein